MINVTDKIKFIKYFILIFYLVGIVGMWLPFSRNLFIRMFPLGILVGVLALGMAHPRPNVKKIVVYFLIYLLSLVVEIIGVKTGKIFGHYSYGQTLGIQIFETPLLIGLNWLLLVYTTVSITNRFNISNWIKLLIGSSLMLLYDIVMEQVSAELHMWYWESNGIPIQNYVAWFFIALLLSGIFRLYKSVTFNPVASTLYISQFLFFLAIMFIQR